MKLRKYDNHCYYLLATIPVLQKHSKFERMSGCNYSFVIEKVYLIEWMTATGLVN